MLRASPEKNLPSVTEKKSAHINRAAVFILAFLCAAFVTGCTAGRYTARPEKKETPKKGESKLRKQLDEMFPRHERMQGIASFYDKRFVKKKTSNGEVYDPQKLTAAHQTIAFNTMLRVTNLKNGKSVVVRVNDRGPFVADRIIDLSTKAAEEIDMVQDGIAQVMIEVLGTEEPKN